MTSATLSQLPPWVPLFAILAIGVALFGAFGLILLLRGMRELRSGIADEVRRELVSKDTASKVNVQSPLVVQEHSRYVTAIELDRVEKNLKDDLTKGAVSRKKMHEEIETIRVEQASIKTETLSQSREIHRIRDSLEQMPERIRRILSPSQ